MTRRVGRAERGSLRVVATLGVVLVVACGDTTSSPSRTIAAASIVPPSAMCPEGQYPMVAAWALADGEFRWVACTSERDMVLLRAASEERVWADRLDGPAVLFDAVTGEVLAQGVAVESADVPVDADVALSTPGVVDGVQITGGQDDTLIGVDLATGRRLWTRPEGHPYYDDVWAVGDGAVFVDSREPFGIAAFEASTGEVRWRWTYDEVDASPWHATDQYVFALGSDAWVLSTDDGSVYWHTPYGEQPPGSPRMFGALANSTTLFVSFTMVASGGD